MTQLTAAVKGAGGTVADAEIAYRGITAAIKATGGSSADAEGAIRALVQTFSKGKVSAEEIRQQLAERLPGAVTLFAQATGRTGAELDKAFEKGEVGLNDLMKFLATLNTRYSATARQLAASNDEAGLRLQLRWEQTTLAIGEAFKPLGAEIQNSLLKVLASNEGNIKQWADTTVQNIKRVAKAFNDVAFEVKRFSGFIDSIPKEVKVLVRMLPIGFNAPIFQYLGAQGVIDTNKQFNPSTYISGLGGKAQDPSVFQKQLGQVRSNISSANRKISDYGPTILPSDWKQIEALKSTIKIETQKQELLIQALAGAKGNRTPAGKGLTVSQDPTSQGSPDKEADKQRRLAEQLAAEQQRLRETAAQQEIRLADEVFRHQIELDNRRHERQKQLADIRARTEIAGLTPAQRGVAGVLQAIRQGGVDDNDRIRQARQELAQAQRELANARRMEAVTATSLGPASGGGIIARTGNTGIGTGAHLDARWADGRPISAADVDRYLRVNGRAPSSFGVTSGYGPRRAPTRGASSFHRGIDFGTPAGSGISVTNGARLLRDLGFTGAGGYAVEIDTPQGRMRLLHLQGGSASRTPTGVAAQQRRNVVDQGDTAVAAQRVRNAEATLQDAISGQQVTGQARANQLIAEYIQQTDDSTRSIRENTQQLKDRTRYMLEGYSPEQIDAMVQRNSLEREYGEITEYLNRQLAEANSPEAAKQINDLLNQRTKAYQDNTAALNEQLKAQIESRRALNRFKDEFNQLTDFENTAYSLGKSIETSISGAISTSVTNIATGSANIKQSLSEMFASIGKSFIDMAAQIIAKQLVIIALNSIAKVFGGGGGSSLVKGVDVPVAQMPAGMAFANGGIMTEAGPMPLNRYASGGVVQSPQVALFGERGPEAYVPLPDGRSIPVKLSSAMDRYRPDNGSQYTQAGSTGEAGAANGSGQSATIDVRYSVERINSVDYVTAEQFHKGMQDAARKGAAMGQRQVYSDFANKRSLRQRLAV